MSLHASNVVRAAPASICPACPRSSWISGRNGAVEAMAASTDKAPVTSVAQARPWARNNPEMAHAVDKRLTLADHDGCHMRKRRQITGRSHRSLLRHQRINASRQHGLELLDD